MFDKKDRDRHRDVALATLHQTGELTGYRAAGECKELDRHRRLRSAALADIRRIPVVCEARIAASSVWSNGESGSCRAPRPAHPVAARAGPLPGAGGHRSRFTNKPIPCATNTNVPNKDG